MVYNALECAEFDYYALFVLCLLYAMSHNKGKSVLCEGDQGPLQNLLCCSDSFGRLRELNSSQVPLYLHAFVHMGPNLHQQKK